jgi:hypothetical protein
MRKERQKKRMIKCSGEKKEKKMKKKVRKIIMAKLKREGNVKCVGMRV